ncbi:facilitated trehalose transporter Tret1-like [Bicyclus anynana]|uniref:Facilitated trehalose transporter Tret1-like n=1 Tax=Bicyclus anynana TaxID=110368 RepID=A0A6J1P3Z4_BICAN|nr:facilitated trehalose transporter Tret1-like [Bicyclus anynana]
MAMVGQRVGRRWVYIICSTPSILNWILLYNANSFAVILLSRFFAGLSTGPLMVLHTAVVAEFATQETRGFHLSLATVVSPTVGITLGHVLGILLHWRTSALIGIFLAIIHVILPYFWFESPHWLALKGRFEQCETAFRRLHGNGVDTEKELSLLIKVEKNKQKVATEMKSKNILRKLINVFKKRYFWDLMLMTTFLYAFYSAAGKVIFSTLATVILKDVTGTSDILLFTLLVDAFVLLGSLISCVLVKRASVRVTLFRSSLVSIAILLILSACLYFKNDEAYFRWINVTLLAAYFIVIHAGPYPVIEIILGELFPLELKLFFFFISSPMIMATIFLCVLLVPYIVNLMGYHGLFFLNAIIMSVCLLYFYIRLPETKGKTLQEIEVYFKTKNFDIEEVLNNNEQLKSLI